MRKRREVRALPSMIDPEDGNGKELEKMSQEERANLWEQLRRHMEKSLDSYYSSHPKEWPLFLRTVQKTEE